MQHSCYVCHGEIDLEKQENNKGPREEHWSYVCHKKMKNNDIQYRHLWHGVPGITRAVGGFDSFGFTGYALTLEDAKRRAEYYINNNPYAAPEVKAGEKAVLDAVKLEEKLNFEPYY